MSIDVSAAEREFNHQIAGYAEQEQRRQIAALRVIAAHALTVAPQATHMLIESSDQGSYVSVPSFLTVGEDNVAESEWDAYVEEHEDSDLTDAPSWLPWADGPHGGWAQFVDEQHPFTSWNGGYYAVDLRRVVAETAPVWDGIAATDERPGQLFEA